MTRSLFLIFFVYCLFFLARFLSLNRAELKILFYFENSKQRCIFAAEKVK